MNETAQRSAFLEIAEASSQAVVRLLSEVVPIAAAAGISDEKLKAFLCSNLRAEVLSARLDEGS